MSASNLLMYFTMKALWEMVYCFSATVYTMSNYLISSCVQIGLDNDVLMLLELQLVNQPVVVSCLQLWTRSQLIYSIPLEYSPIFQRSPSAPAPAPHPKSEQFSASPTRCSRWRGTTQGGKGLMSGFKGRPHPPRV